MSRKWLHALLLGLAGNVWAGTDDVMVNNAWLRESVPGQDKASLQLNLTSTRRATLVAVSSPLADAVEIQRLAPSQGRMKARVIPSLRLPRDHAVTFGDRALYLMLVGLKQPLNVGDHIPVSLTVAFADRHTRKLETEAEVRPLDLSYKHYAGDEVYDHR